MGRHRSNCPFATGFQISDIEGIQHMELRNRSAALDWKRCAKRHQNCLQTSTGPKA